MSQSTKTKTQLTTVDEDPRVRMREIRSLVAKAVKEDRRIDLMEFNDRDTARVIIALQDQLRDTQTRHRKASNHIAAIKEMVNMFDLIMEQATETLVSNQERTGELSMLLRQERESHMQTASVLNEMATQNQQLNADLESSVNTIRIALNGSTN